MKKSILVIAVSLCAFAGAHAQVTPTPEQWHAFHRDHRPMMAPHERGEFKGFTKEQFLKRAQAHFIEMDANKDGFVSPEEMHLFHERHHGLPHEGAPQGEDRPMPPCHPHHLHHPHGHGPEGRPSPLPGEHPGHPGELPALPR